MTKNKAWIFVNSFSFNFIDFLAKIYWANFFHGLRKRKRAVHGKSDRPSPRDKVGWPAQSDRPRWAPAAFRPVSARFAPFRLPSSVRKF
jgi:hypothetical protein